jgi:hypothetical protein
MRRSSYGGVVALSILVTACGGRTPSSDQASHAAPPSQPGAARQQLLAAETLCQQLAANPQLAPLRGRLLPADPAVPWSRAMMIDQSYVSERDRALLVVMDTARAECRRALLSASPGQAVPFLDYWQKQDNALVRLYNREIPVSTYNRTMADAQTQFTIEVSNQQTDLAVRAHQPGGDMSPPESATARRTDAAPQLPLESFRALRTR